MLVKISCAEKFNVQETCIPLPSPGSLFTSHFSNTWSGQSGHQSRVLNVWFFYEILDAPINRTPDYPN